MKQLKLLLFLMTVSLAHTSSAQMLPRHVFCSGGGNFESAAIHVSWTIGQAEPVATFYEPTIIFSAGFQQFDDQPVMLQEMSGKSEIMVYPNPCNDFVCLDFQSEKSARLSYKLYDFSGKILINKDIPGQASRIQELIELTDLAPGMYNLMVVTENDNIKSYESFKLIRN